MLNRFPELGDRTSRHDALITSAGHRLQDAVRSYGKGKRNTKEWQLEKDISLWLSRRWKFSIQVKYKARHLNVD
jgi:hypothetical protein